MDIPPGEASEPTPAEVAFNELLADAHLAAPYELPDLINTCALQLGCREAICYLIDLQQHVLVPFLGPAGAAEPAHVEELSVDSTLAGHAFQHIEMRSQPLTGGTERWWLPMLDGTERLGVLAATVPASSRGPGDALAIRLDRLASMAAELVMTKSMYGDTIVRLRRRSEMGVAAEIQWSLLPPLTFASQHVTIAAALEPAYEIAGDTIDYAVDAGVARAAIFDGMGHGMQAAQLAVLTVAAYRNARRGGQSLTETAAFVDSAVHERFASEAFTTGILAELAIDSGQLTWINAGHPAPLLLRGGKLVKTLELEAEVPFGLGAGVASVQSHIGTEHLEHNDRVLLYTDGAIEARSPAGDFFGVERLIDLTVRHLASDLPAPETMRRLVHALLEHQQGQLNDDASLLMLEWRNDTDRQKRAGSR